MKNKAMIAALAALLCLSPASLSVKAAEEARPGMELSEEKESERAVSLYVVGGAVLLIWLGVSAYLWRMDRRISRLEKKIHEG